MAGAPAIKCVASMASGLLTVGCAVGEKCIRE